MANQFGGFGGFGETQNQVTVDDLLNAAKLQGGRVAEVAAELADPRRSIISTIGSGFKNAFTGFMDLIAKPNQAVAAMISPDIDLKTAFKENVSVSDVVFGDKDVKSLTTFQKVGDFVARTAVDVLTDPLTYVTFGASRGVLGLSSASKAFAGEKTAAKLGLKNVGDKFALSENAEKLANEFLIEQRKGLRTDFFSSKRQDLVKQLRAVGVDEASRKDAYFAIREFDESISDQLTNTILNGRLSKDYAVQTVGKLIEKHPALIETLVDKGGIKFFGKSILSGQRISGVVAAIPGMTVLDHLTQPARNALGAAFSRDYVFDPRNPRSGGKLPDEYIRLKQRSSDMVESMQNELMVKLPRIYKEAGLGANEAKFITAAIETGIRPRDPKALEIWERINGVEASAPVLNPRVWDAVGIVKEQIKTNRKMLEASGLPTSNYENYIRHILVKNEVGNMGFRTPPVKDSVSRKFAKISTLVDEAGNRFPVAFHGKPSKATGDVTGTVLKEGEKVNMRFKADGNNFVEVTKGENGRLVEGTSLTRARATIEEAKNFGIDFEENSLTATLLASMEVNKVAVSRHFMQDAAEKLGAKASEAPAGWRPINVTGMKYEGDDLARYMATPSGEEIYFHPLVAKDIEEFTGQMGQDGATEGIMHAYDKLQNLFKATVTSIFPSFHGRNAISNVMLSFMDIGYEALNPVNHAKVAQIIGYNMQHSRLQKAMAAGKEGAAEEFGKLMSRKVFKDNTGYEWTFGELRTVVHNNVVAFHPRNLGQIDQVQFGKDDAMQISEKLFPTSKKDVMMNKFRKVNPFSTNNMAITTGLKVGSLIEDHARLLTFTQNLRATGDPLLAAERTKMFLFDYQNLSNFERKVLRRIIPFYTFSRKNIELQVKTLFSRPGVIAGEIRAVQTIGDTLGGGDLTEEERNALPEWVQSGINTVLRRDGSHVEILSTIGSPIEQPFQQLQPNQALASVSPILRVPAELMSGYSVFHGKPISEVTNAAAFKSAPEPLKDFIGFTEVQGKTKDGKEFTYYASLRPERMHLVMNLPPTARVWSTIKQLQKDDVSTNTKIWQQLVGFNPYEFDLEIEAKRREDELKGELEQVLDTANVGYSINRFIIPKDTTSLGDGFEGP